MAPDGEKALGLSLVTIVRLENLDAADLESLGIEFDFASVLAAAGLCQGGRLMGSIVLRCRSAKAAC